MRRPRILILIGQLSTGGTERQVVNTALAVDRRRFAVSVGVLSSHLDLAPGLRAAGIPVRSFAEGQRYTPAETARLALAVAVWVRHERIGLIHSFLYPANVIGSLAAALARVPIVVSERTTPPRLPRSQRAAYYLVSRAAAAVVLNSHAARDAYTRQARIPAGRAAVHANGVDFARLDLAPDEEVRAQFGVAAGEPLVGAVGRIDRMKQYELLLRAAGEMQRSGTCARFVIVGDAGDAAQRAYLGELRALRAELGLAERVIFPGGQSNVAAFLRAFDIFALTSAQEGTPNALLEALALGVPALTTDAGDAGRIVRTAAAGRVLPPVPGVWAEEIAALLGDARLRAAMGANGRQYVRARFGLGRLARATEALWERLLDRQGTG